MDIPTQGGIGGEMWLEVKFGINTGKESTHGMLGKMDERPVEMKGRGLSNAPPFQMLTRREPSKQQGSELVTGSSQGERNPSPPVPVRNINNMQTQLKKFFLCHIEKLIFLCCCDSLGDYSYKNAVCRTGQTCRGKTGTSLECLPIPGTREMFPLQRSLFLLKDSLLA